MLLKLDKELKQTDTINYACLPQNRFDTPKPGDMCTIAGWGVHSKNLTKLHFSKNRSKIWQENCRGKFYKLFRFGW